VATPRIHVTSVVEPPEPMKGLEIPAALVDQLGGGKKPYVVVTVNGHSWRTRVAIMRGRNLIGLSNANRLATGVEIGDEVEVSLELDTEPSAIAEPTDLASALDADPVARASFDRLSPGKKRAYISDVEKAKKPETRERRIAAVIDGLR
jgi:hypothetical protein